MIPVIVGGEYNGLERFLLTWAMVLKGIDPRVLKGTKSTPFC